MQRFIIKGQKPLSGEIKVNGAKNAALKFLAAALLSADKWTLSNIPQIEDIFTLAKLIQSLGVNLSYDKDAFSVHAIQDPKTDLNPDLAIKLRASVLLTGPLIARCGHVFLPYPGGCAIGQRPIDIFLKGFSSLGVKIKAKNNGYVLTTSSLRGNKFFFPQVSVTATETLMMAACLARGKTLLWNAACEPEIPFLADFLNQCGAKIKGAGTPFIEIEGVSRINGGDIAMMSDRIEMGTFAVLAVACGNNTIKIINCQPEHAQSLWLKLKEAGAKIKLGPDWVEVQHANNIRAVDLKTQEYPGFATDLQAPFCVLMTRARGVSLIHETIFESRLFYTDILNHMGARIIMADPHRAIVVGPTQLCGQKIISPDIRAGIALLIAGLMAKGETIIENIYQIDRGYEKIEERLRGLGADIKRVS
ncbi:MAG: UDP-N-acetylglucosamine 1-carboxyvinyltransferase [Candidatus Portnoybacteria bacterium CG10_big_fil_rev_8_21_14_0_10_40_22]|uniref:UDP-N-acetylglucosamine 1-carboxyvinyltransferase n=2 Tax=Candidatus Portnoyibacteriota TaxID=1817913 RepID=A0A2M8KGK3_9BACT|nr:MAG: UDP-N-acetylglucosamine 1-carboxyvinyltransferase [Candidatus Portnoybacteria bacterium CG_4_10_14_0_2_um_filter_39_11]PJE59003.1 MAG: UDP-N-acetylglucosamine 1-carboxyvinyltransferase [Candidatus Portnoybacteria bacterium CG10_big_fil_rev_8_21_14_0_10_40_22]